MSAVDLEDAIYLAWRTSDDLDMFYKHHGDHPIQMTEDEVSNALWGIKVLHDMRMEQLFTMYKKQFKLDEFCTDPDKLKMREKLFKAIDEAHEFMETPKKKGKKK
jgi:hypothetical protein